MADEKIIKGIPEQVEVVIGAKATGDAVPTFDPIPLKEEQPKNLSNVAAMYGGNNYNALATLSTKSWTRGLRN